MVAEMLLEIENLGLINKANLDIGKINVIVGKNSTGKSTSSKFLFSLLTAASSEGTQLANIGGLKDHRKWMINLNKLEIL